MRAAIYARYSSELQRDASIEDQVRLCRARIDTEKWTPAGVYTDHAMSGSIRMRPGYQKLLEDARAGGFEIVVSEALDRLSRDQEDVAGLYKHLSFAGVTMITLAEGAISELHVGLKGTMNALFLKDLGKKTWRGLEGRVRQGRSGGGLCYGYDVVKETDALGDPLHGGRTVNDAEAAIIRRIFANYSTGKSPRAIARDLNLEALPGPGGRAWVDTTIRGHFTRRTGILNNELYAGRLIWNKQRYVRDPRTGKRLARPNAEDLWVVHDIPELRIIDQAMWDKVHARLSAVREVPGVKKAIEKKFWLKRRAKHLLTGLAKCGVCGGDLAPAGQDYLACSAARRKGTCSNKKSVRRPVLEGIILDTLKDNLMAPDLVKEFIREFHAEVNRRRHDVELGAGLKRKELDDVTRKLDGLISAIADGLRATGLQTKLDELEARKVVLEKEVAAAPTSAPRLHPNLAEVYRRKVENLQEALRDPSTHSEALDILRGLVDRVVVTPAGRGFTIELIGAIAHMIKLSAGSESLTKEPYLSSVKVVAGRGFEPLTFRL
jgi:site-specific DNA recombinase